LCLNITDIHIGSNSLDLDQGVREVEDGDSEWEQALQVLLTFMKTDAN
jgi:hypothetical protein